MPKVEMAACLCVKYKIFVDVSINSFAKKTIAPILWFESYQTDFLNFFYFHGKKNILLSVTDHQDPFFTGKSLLRSIWPTNNNTYKIWSFIFTLNNTILFFL